MLKLTITLLIMLISTTALAITPNTTRTPQYENNKVQVWETIIYPSKNQILKSHRHERDRILVAFDSGILKVTNDKNQTHYLKLQKNKSYYLSKDVPGETHTDENISHHPIKVLIIELKN
jgi:beta-alanine degradation protein BauB